MFKDHQTEERVSTLTEVINTYCQEKAELLFHREQTRTGSGIVLAQVIHWAILDPLFNSEQTSTTATDCHKNSEQSLRPHITTEMPARNKRNIQWVVKTDRDCHL